MNQNLPEIRKTKNWTDVFTWRLGKGEVLIILVTFDSSGFHYLQCGWF